ncbi:DNA polymerase III subunit delta' [Thiothrix subterranea]|uniref:DNA-directed DNA polymerase n=1 Tax=Thiothrix subterranea TaxID=2735563 RepID=A0AA51MJD5_9GAMM|nr:DNA polymerase III subunit delta' [Thiothrix subterranea]MDQ5767722.1 DNA polymerase III subunit delta' [Thiothrix subterranea]WML85527.1 DNA polymerase III subunit delta' [Thiothrix subterranea]
MSVYPWHLPIWQRLQQAKADNHLHHALLFSGEEGCGNEAFLEAFANSLLCLNPADDGSACGQCRSCQVLISQAHPDFMAVKLLDDKQSILIDQIRELNYFLGLSRSYSLRRVVIIQPAERMNINAANSLLKSLEEPSADTHILLLTEHPALLLPTIRSRCQSVRLFLPTHQQALAWLQQHSLQHSVESLLETALGRPLAALALDSTDTLNHRTQWLAHLIQCLQGQGNITDISTQWEKFDKVQLLDWQFTWLKILLKQQAGDKNTPISPELRDLCAVLNQQRLFSMHDKLLELKKLSTHPLNPRLFVESMLILWQA